MKFHRPDLLLGAFNPMVDLIKLNTHKKLLKCLLMYAKRTSKTHNCHI